MGHNYEKNVRITIYEWNPKSERARNERGIQSRAVFDKWSNNVDKVAGDAVAFMLRREYLKQFGFSRSLILWIFRTDISRMADERVNEILKREGLSESNRRSQIEPTT